MPHWSSWVRLGIGVLAQSAVMSGPALGRPVENRLVSFDIPPGQVAQSLVAFGIQAGVTIGTSGTIPHHLGPGLKGRHSLSDGLHRLLAGTGLGFEFVNASTIRITVTPVSQSQVSSAKAVPFSSLSELVVTATKHAVRRDDAGFSIGVLSGSGISRGAADSTSDAAMAIAGLTVTNLGAGRNKIFIRGLSDGALTGRMQSTVSVFVDDARATYNAPDPDLRLMDVARLEVLRGPQGMLYGAGTLGGIYRIVPNAADPSGWAGSVGGELSTISHGAAGYRGDGMLNIPIMEDRLALRLVGYREVDGGYINDRNLGRNVNRTVVYGGRTALHASLGDWSVDVGGVAQSIGSRDTHYTTSDNGALSRSNRLHEPHDNDFAQIRFRVEGQVLGAKLSSTTAYVRNHISSTYDASDALPALAGLTPAAAAFDENDRIDLLTQETRLASIQETPVRWMVGISFLRNIDRYRATLLANGSAVPLYGQQSQDEIFEGSLFGEVEIALSSRWRASVGARALRYRLDADASRMSGIDPPQASDRGARGNRLTPVFGVRYRPDEESVIYAQLAQGYRVGGINASASGVPEPGENADKGRFASDKLWNAELGMRLALADGRIKLSGALFGFIWKDIQTEKLLETGLPYTVNAGNGYNVGVEGEVSVQATDRLSVRLGGLLNNPELRPYEPFRAFGRDLPGVSTGSGFLAMHHEIPIGGRWAASTDASIVYVGKSRLSLTADHNPVMGDYSVVNLQAGLKGNAWTFHIYAENALNTHANSFAFGNPFSFLTTDQRTPLKPRTIGLRVSYQFSQF